MQNKNKPLEQAAPLQGRCPHGGGSRGAHGVRAGVVPCALLISRWSTETLLLGVGLFVLVFKDAPLLLRRLIP